MAKRKNTEWVDPDREIFERFGPLEVTIRQCENGYVVDWHRPMCESRVFKSAEELAQFVALELLHLPH